MKKTKISRPLSFSEHRLLFEVETWLFKVALPFWARNGVDRKYGGFVEQLNFDGSNAHAAFKRSRVTARQIYVFSHAGLLGFQEGAEIAESGFQYLVEKAWLGERRGWARKLAEDGSVIDPTPDLYDLSFIMFASGWLYRLTNCSETLNWSLRTLEFINKHMRNPGEKGFLEQKPRVGVRQQNPHMHLLEAALCNLEASNDDRFRILADEIVELFKTKFFEPSSSTLREYFDNRLNPLSEPRGLITEPGHHFEWAWILAWYQRLSGQDVRSWAFPLIEFAEKYGVNKCTGSTYDIVRADGEVLDYGERIWPSTERIQAGAALFDLDNIDPRDIFRDTIDHLFRKHLSAKPSGIWVDHFDGEGFRKGDKVPASTLYHIFISFSELIRVLRRIENNYSVPDNLVREGLAT